MYVSIYLFQLYIHIYLNSVKNKPKKSKRKCMKILTIILELDCG